ncbi:helix-turn-helix domain-containing protein [Rhizobium sp. 1399]|uniref:helix-turn-helix domain-containing protein n=1 Tax=Rhizobium sp. 1399 TaxID=2817758 RepID=UPI00285FAA59|nr:helix-turn-helix domain-containing protein [Rhizobium sp. 1399]MDR6671243.1 DNA-binding MarR family transcriptional regulator [Rhizobium sp. 1399]
METGYLAPDGNSGWNRLIAFFRLRKDQAPSKTMARLFYMRKLKGMQPQDRLVWHLVKQVVETIFPDETGAARLQQVAVLLTINALQDGPEPVTTARIGEIYGITPSMAHKLIARLLDRGLIEKKTILNRQNRGHSTALRVVETDILKQLTATIRKDS